MSDEPRRALLELARVAGLEPDYTSWRNEPTAASDQSLLAMLAMLGPELGFRCDRPEDAWAAKAACERARWAEVVPEVVVGWAGVVDVAIALPADRDGNWEVDIVTESGKRARATGRLFELAADQHAWPDGVVHCVRHAHIDVGEDGYHEVSWQVAGGGAATQAGKALAICAPERACNGPGTGPRRWGVFAPVYGLAPGGHGIGDLAALAQLFDKVGRRGGRYVATLPLLAQFLDEPCAYSPYSPASRLWWNELYVDLAALAAEAGATAPPTSALSDDGLIDYRAQYAARRAGIDALVPRLLAARTAEIDGWARATGAYDYAAFRALGEAARVGWRAWPRHGTSAPALATTRDAALATGAEPARVDAHVVAQWAMARQLTALGERKPRLAGARSSAEGGAQDDRPVQLYLDLPVGVSCDAYEVWRWRDQFLLDAAAGAPPDPLFLGGQDWGLPPISPRASRRNRHRYFIACVRHHVRAAGVLRIDHVMGLFRQYCIPSGRPATDGVYLRHPHDELLAILALESSRARCMLVGEDLGVVPEAVRPAMARHGLFRIHVGQWAFPARAGEACAVSPEESIAALNTHDTPTFAGWWHGTDITDKLDLGLVDAKQADTERLARADQRAALLAIADARAVPRTLGEPERAMVAATGDLAVGPAEVVLVALDDLVLEPVPHNVPGTTSQRPNWRRRIVKWQAVLDEHDAPAAAKAAVDAVAAARP
jgi:4-alpha-glucanotransferase